MSYIKGLRVVYNDNYNAVDKEDINYGFGGSYVYLVPQYTDKRDEAVCGFSIFTCVDEDLCASDVSKGDGRPYFRYIQTHHHPSNEGEKVVGTVHLKETRMGDGYTDDINTDRGGRTLYLCWIYAPGPSETGE